MSFDKLMDTMSELDELRKALDEQGEQEEQDEQAANSLDEDEDEDEEDEDEDGTVAKSFRVTLEDGQEMEAFDGTDLIKSLTDRLDTQEAESKTHSEAVLKALGMAVDTLSGLQAQVVKQGKLIKSLNRTVADLGGQGRGRKSTLNVHEKPGAGSSNKQLRKSQQGDVTPQEFLAKAEALLDQGKIDPIDLVKAEAVLNRGGTPDEALVRKVFAEG